MSSSSFRSSLIVVLQPRLLDWVLRLSHFSPQFCKVWLHCFRQWTNSFLILLLVFNWEIPVSLSDKPL